MTVLSTTTSVSYAGNGVTTIFAVPFKFLAAGHLGLSLVNQDGTASVPVLGVDYTVAGVGQDAGGSVTFIVPPATGKTVLITRTTPRTQDTSFRTQGKFVPTVHELALDKLMLALQDVGSIVDLNKLNITDFLAGVYGVAPRTWYATGGTGVTSFNISGASSASAEVYFVTIDGVEQDPTDYSIDLTVTPAQIVFGVAPPLNSRIVVRAVGYAKAVGTANDLSVVTATGSPAALDLAHRFADPLNVKNYNVKGDGATDDTVALQAALNAGARTIVFPPGVYKHGPVTVANSCDLMFLEGSSVVPIFDAGTTQQLYYVSAPDVLIDGLRVSNVSGTVSANKYIVYAGAGADGIKVRRCNFSAITMSDGNVGLTNLLVVHGIYIDSCNRATIEDNRINNISGSAVFVKVAIGVHIAKNWFTDTKWYSINLDYGVDTAVIERNVIDGTNVNARHWGGSINLMSQTTGVKNKRIKVINNTITGVHNYGAALRVLSVEDCDITGNELYGITGGSIQGGGAMQYIGIDRRGTAEGAPENGPCINLHVRRNILVASGGPHQAIYIKNQNKASIDPHINISVRDNLIRSPTLTDTFEVGVVIHGFKCGFRRLHIAGNIIEVLTHLGSPVGGAIGLVSTDAGGAIVDVRIENNTLFDITTSVPTISSQVGIFINTFVTNIVVARNHVRNFFYGIRTIAALTNVSGLHTNDFVGNVNDTLYGTAPNGGGFDMSLGTAIPVTGVYLTGHIRQNPSAAASTSYGWVVTTAGGAMTAAWAAGQTYVAGTWYRNTAGRVYELITAGGGTTSVEPSGVVVGVDETGADGYTWRCRALASARWATLPALGAAVALP